MRIVELILDDQQMASGIDAISIVEAPAIESNFIALKSHEIKFAQVDAEKRILMGPVLIPDKPIFRKQVMNGEMQEFYVYFSKNTVSLLGLIEGAEIGIPLLGPSNKERRGYMKYHREKIFRA